MPSSQGPAQARAEAAHSQTERATPGVALSFTLACRSRSIAGARLLGRQLDPSGKGVSRRSRGESFAEAASRCLVRCTDAAVRAPAILISARLALGGEEFLAAGTQSEAPFISEHLHKLQNNSPDWPPLGERQAWVPIHYAKAQGDAGLSDECLNDGFKHEFRVADPRAIS